jgi:hypothetical protein
MPSCYQKIVDQVVNLTVAQNQFEPMKNAKSSNCRERQRLYFMIREFELRLQDLLDPQTLSLFLKLARLVQMKHEDNIELITTEELWDVVSPLFKEEEEAVV